VTAPVLEIRSLSKNYGALRPLRVAELTLAAGDQVALVGFDQPAAEVLVNLITGGALPDLGQVRVFGRSTADINDSDEWLAALDRFGIVSDRAALLESLTTIQNLAIPFTLDIDPPPADIRRRAEAIAGEVALDPSVLDHRAGDLDPAARLRVRFARALALEPSLLLLEHPSASLNRSEALKVAPDLRRAAERRGLAALTFTADREFGAALARRVLQVEPATGHLRAR
jgi:predicted ABC-type transport system involved in lysophospholipase L1 biosynthesis ATPase subunit